MDKPIERRRIYNPYNKLEGHNCFGCSSKNQLGLKMEFYEKGDYLLSEWDPANQYGGYKNVLHGGIQATLMDEIASWCIQVKMKTAGVTAGMNVRYRNPIYTDKGKLLVKSKIVKLNRNLVTLKTEIFDSNERLCCEAELKYFTFPVEVAREKYYFPDFEEFFKEQ